MKLLRQIIKQKLTESIDDARISKLLSLAEEGYDRYLQAKSVALSLNLDVNLEYPVLKNIAKSLSPFLAESRQTFRGYAGMWEVVLTEDYVKIWNGYEDYVIIRVDLEGIKLEDVTMRKYRGGQIKAHQSIDHVVNDIMQEMYDEGYIF